MSTSLFIEVPKSIFQEEDPSKQGLFLREKMEKALWEKWQKDSPDVFSAGNYQQWAEFEAAIRYQSGYNWRVVLLMMVNGELTSRFNISDQVSEPYRVFALVNLLIPVFWGGDVDYCFEIPGIYQGLPEELKKLVPQFVGDLVGLFENLHRQGYFDHRCRSLAVWLAEGALYKLIYAEGSVPIQRRLHIPEPVLWNGYKWDGVPDKYGIVLWEEPRWIEDAFRKAAIIAKERPDTDAVKCLSGCLLDGLAALQREVFGERTTSVTTQETERQLKLARFLAKQLERLLTSKKWRRVSREEFCTGFFVRHCFRLLGEDQTLRRSRQRIVVFLLGNGPPFDESVLDEECCSLLRPHFGKELWFTGFERVQRQASQRRQETALREERARKEKERREKQEVKRWRAETDANIRECLLKMCSQRPIPIVD